VVQLDGQRFRVAKDAAGAAAAPAAAGARRSAVAFAVNGVSQGVAFRDLAGGELACCVLLCLQAAEQSAVPARARRRVLRGGKPVHGADAG
jgi:hypothetical protein